MCVPIRQVLAQYNKILIHAIDYMIVRHIAVKLVTSIAKANKQSLRLATGCCYLSQFLVSAVCMNSKNTSQYINNS